ncbi:putative PIK3R4 kinase-related protein (incomplete catalytic triad) [Neospora caninum Liverpool]|uniref:non-specific serine/threonine protein kinase n=1 Tax=Neospora caninum (strain Liverpool) TaxID=572307 RepID=F0VMQ6_NEOCL|nr:putative PIK3R4 kinase-related protein (incomplete catalytic triad) [Neospora caninum Liverpool]CBZ55002.1 putative PIK3R4 kinase-related protein (incomplete catalytic triad) [Neospora caninum Liverpool]CEL69726.1 TPA: PIK3R4 kinase-related protein (incomplete catalytic triad), putative [Neospora caninum Liverpool]|eukprot:XP_003885030.1 putative PIK3R4 kinase-related protein (incomplete catalytic triad) [Neospora caninum Liverpool]
MGNTVATASATSTGGSPPPPLPTYTPHTFHSTAGWKHSPQAANAATSSAFPSSLGSAQKNAAPGGAPLPDDVAALVPDFPAVTVLRCIGSSRLFRAVLTVTPEDGIGVGKLLVRKDPQETAKAYLQKYVPILEAYTAQLLPDVHPNVCTYGRVLSSDRTVLLLRRFFAHCLADRLHARPFLSATQQLFLAFQLVLGVAQLHSLGLVHGDIKGENVGITSWLHACLIDAAPWKPLRVSLADGRQLTAFFDGSYTGRCYLAPESGHPVSVAARASRFLSEPEDSGRTGPATQSRAGGAGASESFEDTSPRQVPSLASRSTSAFSLASLEALQSADVFSMAATLVEIFTADAPGRQQHVLDLPLLLQLRRALLEQRKSAARGHSPRKTRDSKMCSWRSAGSDSCCHTRAEYGDASAPREGTGANATASESLHPPAGDLCQEALGHGDELRQSEETGRDENDSRFHAEGEDAPICLSGQEAPTNKSTGLRAMPGGTATACRPAGREAARRGNSPVQEAVGCHDPKRCPNRSMAEGGDPTAGGGVNGPCDAQPRPDSRFPDAIAPPPALVRALRGIRSACIRQALQADILLCQPESRSSALDCLERWGAPWSPTAFFPPSFFSCFLPLFTVITHPTYQQPDIRLLLVRKFLPHFVAALLQRRRRASSGPGDAGGAEAKRGACRGAESESRRATAGEERCEREQAIVELLQDAVEQHVASVDPQVMYQCILHSAITSPECSAVAALVGAWGESRRREASAAAGAAASVFQSRLSVHSGSQTPPGAASPCLHLFHGACQEKAGLGSLLGQQPADASHAPPRVERPGRRPRPAPDASGAFSASEKLDCLLASPSASTRAGALDGDAPEAGEGRRVAGDLREREAAAATGAAEAVGGFGAVPHADLSLQSARRFSARLLQLWRKSRRLAVEKHLPPAEVFRQLRLDRRALYDGLFLPSVSDASSGAFAPASSLQEADAALHGNRETGGLGGCGSSSPRHAAKDKEGHRCFSGNTSTEDIFGSASDVDFASGEASEESRFVSAFCDASRVEYPSLAALSAAASRWTCASQEVRRGGAVLLAELIGTTLPHCCSPQVRVCGVSMLAFLARFSTLHSLLNSVLPYLIRALDDPTPSVRVAAVRALPSAISQVALPAGCRAAPGGWGGDSRDAEEPRERRDRVFSQDGNSAERAATSCCYEGSSEEGGRIAEREEEADACDDRAAARSLASGAFDFFVFFSQVLLPRLQHLATVDAELFVRLAVAEFLPSVLLAMRRCLELQAGAQATVFVLSGELDAGNVPLEAEGSAVFSTQGLGAASLRAAPGARAASSPSPVLLLDTRLQQLRTAVKPLLQQVLTSRQPAQRLALLERVEDLARFLGVDEAQQFLLPYLIMQLNDPLAPSIRAAVTLGLGRVGLLLGGARGTVETCVLPCCEQALVDGREEVLLAAVRALQLLASAGLLAPHFRAGDSGAGAASRGSRASKQGQEGPSPRGGYRFIGGLLSLLEQRVLPLLVLPSAAVRREVLHLLRLLETHWGRATSFALLLPCLEPFTESRGDIGIEDWRGLNGGNEAGSRDASAPPVLTVEDLARGLRPPLTRAVYVQLLEPQFRQPLAALGAAVADAERGGFSADSLARVLFQTGCEGVAKERARERSPGLQILHAGGPSRRSSDGDRRRGRAKESASGDSRCSTVHASSEDEDEEHIVSRLRRTFAAYADWQAQRARPGDSQQRPGQWRNCIVDFLAFADRQAPATVSSSTASSSDLSSSSCSASISVDFSPEQLQCLGILLGLKAADREALLLLLPYLRSADRSHASPALLSLAFAPAPPGSPGPGKGAGAAEGAPGPAGADLDEAMPAGQPLGLVADEPEGGEVDGDVSLECPCLEPPKTETAAREYFLMSCLMSPPLPSTVHSLPSLRLSPLQALLPLLPASLVSGSSCEIASLFPVCLVLCLSRQGAALPARTQRLKGGAARGGFLRELEDAGVAATGAAHLLAVAAAAAAGTRRPLPSLQQAMLGLPAPGASLGDLLAADASRLSGPIPFELFPAAVLGACAASAVKPRSLLACASPGAADASAPLDLARRPSSRACALPLPLQRDWRCGVLGLPRRPALEVGRLQKAIPTGSGTLNLYSYLTASPPVLLLRHPLLPSLVPASATAPSRHASSTVSSSALPIAPCHLLDSPSPTSARGTAKPQPGPFPSTVLGAVGGVARLLPSGPHASSISTPGALSSQPADARLDASKAHAGSGSGDTGLSPLPAAVQSLARDAQAGGLGAGGVGAGAGRRAPSAAAVPGPGGDRPPSGSQGSAQRPSGRDTEPTGLPRGVPPTTGCGVVLCAVPGLAEMARWRPKGQLVGMLLEQDTTGRRQLGADLSSAKGRGPRGRNVTAGHRVRLASTEDGRLLVTACMDTVEGRIAAWSCADVVRHGRATPLATWALPSPVAATTLTVLHNTRTLAVGASDGSCRLYRVDGSSQAPSGPRESASSPGRDGAYLLLTLPPPAVPLFSASSSVTSSLLLRLSQPECSSRHCRSLSAGPGFGSACTSPEERFLFRTLLPVSLRFPSLFSSSLSAPARDEGLLAASAARAAQAAAAASRGVVALDHFDSCFEQLLLFLLENGQVGAYDLRAASLPVFSAAALPPWWGLPTAQSVSADGKFLCLGTAGGVLLLFDLRLLLPLRSWRVRLDNDGSRAAVVLQLRPCPLHLLRSHRAAGADPLGHSLPRASLGARSGAGDRSAVFSEEPSASSGSSGPRATGSGTGIDEGDGSSCGPRKTGNCLFLALLGGDTGAAVALDLEAGRVVATFSSSCFSVGRGEAGVAGDDDISDSEEETPARETEVRAGERNEACRRLGDSAASEGESEGFAPRYWLDPLELSSLATSQPSLAPQAIEAGLAATALSPHCPRCLFVPPPLRGPPAFFLTGGNDRCIRFWNLEAAAASYLSDEGLRRGREAEEGRGVTPPGRHEARQGSAARTERTPRMRAGVGRRERSSRVVGRHQGVDAYVVVAPEDTCAYRGSAGRDGDGLGFHSSLGGCQDSGRGGTFDRGGPLFFYEVVEEETSTFSFEARETYTVAHVQEVCRRHGPRAFSTKRKTARLGSTPAARKRMEKEFDQKDLGLSDEETEGQRRARNARESGDRAMQRDSQSSCRGFLNLSPDSEGDDGAARACVFEQSDADEEPCCCRPTVPWHEGRGLFDRRRWSSSVSYPCGENGTFLSTWENEERLRDAGPRPPSVQHRDAILDLSFVELQQQLLLVSSGRDGVVKIWR